MRPYADVYPETSVPKLSASLAEAIKTIGTASHKTAVPCTELILFKCMAAGSGSTDLVPALAIRIGVPGQTAGPGRVSKRFADALYEFGTALTSDFRQFIQEHMAVAESIRDRGIQRVTVRIERHMGKGKKYERFADVRLGSETTPTRSKKKLRAA